MAARYPQTPRLTKTDKSGTDYVEKNNYKCHSKHLDTPLKGHPPKHSNDFVYKHPSLHERRSGTYILEKKMEPTHKTCSTPQAFFRNDKSSSRLLSPAIRSDPHAYCSTSKSRVKCKPRISNEIKFYDTYGEYGEFTNFYPSLTLIDGFMWRTSEHYFQAQKFVGTPYVEYVRSLKTPREAFQFSREQQAKQWIRSDWQYVKDGIMKKALFHKFSQNKKLRRLLLDTEGKHLVEHTENDSYWGDGGDGSGKNKLGILLMEVRDCLRAELEVRAKSTPSSRNHSSIPKQTGHGDSLSCSKSKDKLPVIEPRKYFHQLHRKK